jgi:disulfide bond formation protein DsbB
MRLSEHYAADLPRLLAYELRAGETAEVVEHLRACDECRRDLVEAIADTYPPGTVLPRWFTAPPARKAAQVRSEAVFLSLVLLPCLLLIATAAIVALVKT